VASQGTSDDGEDADESHESKEEGEEEGKEENGRNSVTSGEGGEPEGGEGEEPDEWDESVSGKGSGSLASAPSAPSASPAPSVPSAPSVLPSQAAYGNGVVGENLWSAANAVKESNGNVGKGGKRSKAGGRIMWARQPRQYKFFPCRVNSLYFVFILLYFNCFL
jgi:hypothetical protein